MSDSLPLPASKFGPRPLGPKPLERTRLLDMLEQNSHAKLVMLHAPAGYGKSTLMSQWYARLIEQGQGVGWVGLDEDDNDAGRLVAALSLALSPTSNGSADLFDCINLCLQEHAQFTLFLDDEEWLTATDAQHLFEVLLKLSPPAFHLVIGSRAQPQRLSTRLRMRSDFLEISTRDLAFRPEEISQFIRLRCDVTLDAETEAYLARRSEGWPAVLQLTAADICQGKPARTLFEHGASGSANVFQYLSDEVMIHLRPEQHEFLLQTAFIDELSGPLCDAITLRSDGDGMLQELQQSNLLVQAVDASRHTYRYHTLFAEFLRQQLHQWHPELLPRLARRASEWCRRAGRAESAVEYALLAADQAHLIACVRGCIERLIMRAQFETAKRWLRAISPELLQQQADLLIWRAWVDIYTNEFAAAQAAVDALASLPVSQSLAEPGILRALLALLYGRYQQAENAIRTAWPLVLPADLRMLAALTNIRALLQLMRARFSDVARDTECVLAMAVESVPNWLSYVHAAYIASMMELSLGNLSGAWRQVELPERRMQQAARKEEFRGNRTQLLTLLSAPRALVLYLFDRLEDAEDSLERYQPFLNTTFSPSGRALWHLMRIRLLALRADEDACQDAMQTAAGYAGRHGIGWMQVMLQWQRVDQDICRGDVDRARALAGDLLGQAQLDVEPEWLSPWEELFGASICALRLLIYSGDARRALEYLPIHIRACQRQLRRLRLVKLHVLEALAQQLCQQPALALAALRSALGLAQSTGAVRIFFDEGAACRDLLRELRRESPPEPEHGDFLERLRSGFEQAEADPAAEIPIPLSTRELQIIRRLAEGHSNLAVGQQLFLSPNTVKWHLSQIYAKLGVKNRTQAVHVAKQYQLTDLG